MRRLLCLCLASGLLAGDTPQPGKNEAFLRKILADDGGTAPPWRTLRIPEAAGAAVVEVLGEWTPEERRQVAFREFLVWFQADLQRFFRRHGGGAYLEASLASSALPVERHGGNPLPRPVPLGRAAF